MVVLIWNAVVAALIAGAASQPSPAVEPDRQVVTVVAERFSFTPSVIKVKQGTVLELRLMSEDTNHGFRIIGTDAKAIIPKRGRGTATVTYRADTKGRLTFQCSKPCGAGHHLMRGTIIVE